MGINSLWKNIKNKKGITLVELLIAMAIAAMVVAVATSMLLFVNTVFNRGEAQYDVQSKNRLASDYIQKQVRYASDLYLADDPPATVTKFDQQFLERIYINGSNQLVHDKWDSTISPSGAFKTVFKTQYQLAGSKFALTDNKLLINLSPSSNYALSSEIALPNLLPTNPSDSARPVIVFTRDISSAGLAAVLETITFNTNGGSYIAPIQKAAGSPITAPANPTKSGSTFAGWSITVPTIISFPTIMPVGGLLLTAIWTTVPPVVTTIVVSGPNPATTGTGNETKTYQYLATVKDQFGNQMNGQTIVWSATNLNSLSSISSTGLLSLRNFNTTSTGITARVGTVTGSLVVTVN